MAFRQPAERDRGRRDLFPQIITRDIALSGGNSTQPGSDFRCRHDRSVLRHVRREVIRDGTAVIVATFLAGSGAGCLAALLSILATWLLISPAEISALALYQMTIFGTGSLTVVALIGAMRAATAKVMLSRVKICFHNCERRLRRPQQKKTFHRMTRRHASLKI